MSSSQDEELRNKKIQSFFYDPYKTSDQIKEMLKEVVDPSFGLLPESRKLDHAFLGQNPALTLDFNTVHDAIMPEHSTDRSEVLKKVSGLFQGGVNWGSSLAMCNVNPEPNMAAIQAFIITAIFSPNILEGEYAWNVHKAELEVGAMLGDLAWHNGKDAGCIFTYGGEGGWQYAIQYGKTRVLKDSMHKGVYTPVKVICSRVAQFSKTHSTVWSGIGLDNLIQIPVDDDNRMKLDELEKVLKDLHEKDIPVATIVATQGTTDTNSFDPLEGIYNLMQKYPNNPAKYGKAVLYADAVIGFSWLSFKGYDFEANPLKFNKDTLPFIKEMYGRAEQIKYTDCYSTDFHKSGYCPYVSTSFNYKDAKEFESLMAYEKSSSSEDHNIKYAYLQERSPYNPMYYSLESSRAGTGSVAAWATLHYFGRDGFRLVNGWEVEHHTWLRNKINEHSNMVVTNPNNHGQVTLFRVYDNTVKDAKAEYEKELSDPAYKQKLIEHNKLIEDVGNKLYSWARTGKMIDGRYTPYTSFSTGYRATRYNENWEDKEATVYALKIYLMQFHADYETLEWTVKCVNLALEEVLAEREKNNG